MDGGQGSNFTMFLYFKGFVLQLLDFEVREGECSNLSVGNISWEGSSLLLECSNLSVGNSIERLMLFSSFIFSTLEFHSRNKSDQSSGDTSFN